MYSALDGKPLNDQSGGYMIATAIMLWMVVRGVVEGQIMTCTGVRSHQWFPGYHWLCLMRDGLLITVVMATYHLGGFLTLQTLAALVLGWELFEASYNFTRYRRFIVEHENVMGILQLTNGADVWLLHSFRVLIGAGIFIWGVL